MEVEYFQVSAVSQQLVSRFYIKEKFKVQNHITTNFPSVRKFTEAEKTWR